MNVNFVKISLLVASCIQPLFTQGQVSYFYDQQSALENPGGGLAWTIQTRQPIGQSFTPELSFVGFVRLWLGDRTNGNNVGATMVVHVRSDSMTGPILGTSDQVVMADSFIGYPDFFFPEPVAVTPGVTYYLHPVVQAGDPWAIIGYNSYHYAGGVQYMNGFAQNFDDLWFREGVIVPEPSVVTLAVAGAGSLLWLARRRRRRPRATFPRA